jgi:hypothetical protein
MICEIFYNEQKILDDDKLDLYNDLLLDDKIPENFKDLIRYFLIPNKVSILKYTLNKEYYEDPFPVDFRNNHKHIAPSLKKIKENPFDIAMGYPSWFFIAFPDVAFWAMKGDGLELIKKRFKNLMLMFTLVFGIQKTLKRVIQLKILKLILILNNLKLKVGGLGKNQLGIF